MTSEVVVLPDVDAVMWEAASRVAAAGRAAMAERGRFTLALSGGSTPRELFRLLAMGEWMIRVPWEATHIFWADDRCVPPDDPDSNYGVARATLLSRLPTPPEQIHRWFGDAPDPTAEAARYAAELREHTDAGAGGMPRLDLILLGMGDDGHTASLFPRSPALAVEGEPTATSESSAPPTQRLTLTYPALNAARNVIFLVAGAGKAVTLARVLDGRAAADELPARGVRPNDGALTWLVDEAAAARLTR